MIRYCARTMEIRSIIDDGYVGLLGSDSRTALLSFLERHGIAPQKSRPEHTVCSIGFSEQEQKWYGWSHRAQWGFGIGSEVKKGDVAYKPTNKEEFRQTYLEFFGVDEFHKDPKVVDYSDENGVPGALITATYTDDVPNESLRGTEYRHFLPYLHEKFGRGEWEAKTLEDAKQRAIDFADGVA